MNSQDSFNFNQSAIYKGSARFPAELNRKFLGAPPHKLPETVVSRGGWNRAFPDCTEKLILGSTRPSQALGWKPLPAVAG